MCGIIGVFSDSSIHGFSFKQFLSYAHSNKHRGEDDGLGFIDLTDGDYFKTTLTLDELFLNKIKKKDKKKIELSQRLKAKWDAPDRYYPNAIFHHRKASFGNVEIRNTHPIKYNGHLYMHNGSLCYPHPLQNYLSIFKQIKWKTDTDTELLAHLTDDLIKRNGQKKNTLKNTYWNLLGIANPFGVIIRYNPVTKNTIIFKDSSRTLYLITLGSEESVAVLMSEPTPELQDYLITRCYEIHNGIVVITKDGVIMPYGRIRDFTTELKMLLSGFNFNKDIVTVDDVPYRKYFIKGKCESCEEDKFITRKKGEVWDKCIDCHLRFKLAKLQKQDSDKKEAEKYLKKKLKQIKNKLIVGWKNGNENKTPKG